MTNNNNNNNTIHQSPSYKENQLFDFLDTSDLLCKTTTSVVTPRNNYESLTVF